MEDLDGEIWKPIIYRGVDYTGIYEVSNLGRVKSLRKNIILKPANTKGYSVITMCLNLHQIVVKIHRLVVCCFDRCPNYEKREVIDHVNSIKTDNRLSNLKIVTVRQNCSKEKTLKSKTPCGVTYSYYKDKISIRSSIVLKKHRVHLGSYKTIESASKAYNIALFFHEKGKSVGYFLNKVDKYRVSIGLNPVKRIATQTIHNL